MRPISLTQTGVIPFGTWRLAYAYLIDCIVHCIEVRMATHDVRLDPARMRGHLERHLYRTSANRFRAFVLHK